LGTNLFESAGSGYNAISVRKRSRLNSSGLKRSRTTFEPRNLRNQSGSNNTFDHPLLPLNHNPVSGKKLKNNVLDQTADARTQRSVRKMLSQMSLSKRRSLSCGALTVVQE